MIYNRTQSDVDEAKRIRDEKIKNFQELTDGERHILEKGTITINTLNRIEGKIETLKNSLNELGYWNTDVSVKSWTAQDIFSKEDFENIIKNINILRKSFFVYRNTPNTPPISYNYSDINSIEKILYDIGIMIDDLRSKFKECGAYQCGEDNI